MAAKRTLGWISGLTLATMMAGCASQTPTVTPPQNSLPNHGPAIIEGDTLILPAGTMQIQGQAVKTEAIRWSAKDFASLPGRIDAAGGEAADLVPGPALDGMFPGGFGGGWPGAWGGAGFCPPPYGLAFGTPGIFPKTLFISPEVYYLRRNALYFPYSRLGGYFYPISVPYGARFYTPLLAYGFGGLAPYTFTSDICPLPQPFPGGLPCGPGLGGPGIGGPGIGGPGYGGPGMGGPGYLPPGGGMVNEVPSMGEGKGKAHEHHKYSRRHVRRTGMGARY